MATRKKKSPKDGSDGAAAFAVALEQMRGDFKVFGEQLQSFDAKFTAKLSGLDDKVEAGFARVDVRFARVEHEIGLLKIAVIDHGRELKKKVGRDEIEEIVERVVARRR